MASVTLSAAGNAILPGIGGIVGGAVGSLIDNTLLFPALFPPEDAEGPRVGEIRLQGTNEGAPSNFVLGPESRVPGNVIWISDLIEVKKEEEVGGKGGGQEFTTYSYFVHLAVEVHVANPVKAIDGIEKIWVEGKLLYDDTPNVDITSTQISCTLEELQRNQWAGFGLPFNVVTYQKNLIFESPDGGPDLSQFVSGKTLVVSGYTSTSIPNNGTWLVLESGIDSITGVSTVKVRIDPVSVQASTNAAGASITLFQELPKFNDSKVSSVTIYPGNDTQVADPLIEASQGVGNVPGYRNNAIVVFEMLALQDFGNRVPLGNFEFLTRGDVSITVGEAIRQTFLQSGRPSEEIDVTGVSGSLRGFNKKGLQTTVSALQPIMIAYDILAQERNGKFFFFDRDNAPTVAVEAADLAAHEVGSDTPRPFKIVDEKDVSLPSEVNVSYQDPDLDYQRGSQRERRRTAAGEDKKQMDLPLVLTASQARNVAARLLWTPQANGRRVQLSLPPSYFNVVENDILTFTSDGEDWRILVTRIDEGRNGVIDVEGLVEESALLDFDSPADEPKTPTLPIYFPPEMRVEILDIPALQDDQTRAAGYYFAMAAEQRDIQFAGAFLFQSTDGNTTFTNQASVPVEATMGQTTEALPDGPTGWWDRENTLDIQMIEGELDSKTEEEVLNGGNRLLIGNEIIGYATAALISGNTYRIATLLRGLRNTEEFTGTHLTGERVVHLNRVGVQYETISLASIGTTRGFKGVAAGAVESDVDSQDVILAANTLTPFSPSNFRGVLDGSDWELSWNRRTRAIARLLSGTEVPLLENSEAYEVDIMNGASVVRTITTSSESATYTSAQQVTDFGSDQSTITARVYQISDSVGRGRYNEKTF